MTAFVHDLVADKPAEALAVTDTAGARLTYGALREAAAALSARLEAHGVRPGDRLVCVFENGAPFAVAVLAASLCRAWFIPLNARMAADEIHAASQHAGARTLLFAHGSDAARAHAARWHALPFAAGLDAVPAREAVPEPVEDDPKKRVAALLYTTGTTSRPKGVMLTHANLTWNARISAGLRGMAAHDVNLGVLPGAHVFGFSSAYLASLHAGAAIHFVARFSPEAVLAAIADGASIFCGVPQMFERILAHLEATGAPLVAPRLKYLSAGGAPLDPDWKARVEDVFGLTLNNGYGLTETSPSAAATQHGVRRADTSVGGAVPECTLTIDAPDEDGVGELLIRSAGVMKGYYRDDDATRAVLSPDGTFRSGDLARFDETGALYIVGRKKELIIRSGFNVYPPEVEAMMTRHPDVWQAAVVGRPVTGNEEIVAFFTGRASPETVRGFLGERLAAYKRPQHLIRVEAFPTAATGKILKHTLLTHFAHTLAAPAPAVSR